MLSNFLRCYYIVFMMFLRHFYAIRFSTFFFICEKSGPGRLGATRYNSKLSCKRLTKAPKTAPFIDYLDLSNLSGKPTMKHLVSYLSKFPNLKIVMLDNNKFIKNIPARIFNGMRKLKVVSLKGLNSKTLPDQLFSTNPILKCLILKDSKLTELKMTVFSSNVKRKLKEIDLTGSAVKKPLNKYFKGKKRLDSFFNLIQ